MAGSGRIEEQKKGLKKALRKKPQTLNELAARIGKGVTSKQLTNAISQLVAEGEVNKTVIRDKAHYAKS